MDEAKKLNLLLTLDSSPAKLKHILLSSLLLYRLHTYTTLEMIQHFTTLFMTCYNVLNCIPLGEDLGKLHQQHFICCSGITSCNLNHQYF